MEVAVAQEAFLQEREEGEMTFKRRRLTSIDPEGMTPTGTAMEVATTTTRDEQDGGQLPRDEIFMTTE